jgi:hypothetical protein
MLLLLTDAVLQVAAPHVLHHMARLSYVHRGKPVTPHQASPCLPMIRPGPGVEPLLLCRVELLR